MLYLPATERKEGLIGMEPVIIKTMMPDDVSVAPVIFATQQMRLIQEGKVLAALEKGHICGAIGMVQKDYEMEILSLYVEAEFRHQGIGSMLLQEALNQTKKKKITKIVLSYSCTEEENLFIMSFFVKNGFPAPVRAEVLYVIPMEEIKNSSFVLQKSVVEKTESRISPLSGLPFDIWEKSKIPDYMRPDQVPGILLKELSFVYVAKGKICACILMSDNHNGNVHLHAAFLKDGKYGIYLIGMLQKAYNIIKEKYPHYQNLTITGINDEGKNLIEHLLKGAKMQRKITHKIELPIVRNEIFRPAGFYGTFMRFHALADELAERGLESRLITADGSMPYMEIVLSEDKSLIRVSCDVLGGENYSGFEWKIFCDISEETEKKIKDSLKLNRIENVEILKSEDEESVLFGRYEEKEGYDVTKYIEQFLSLFSVF